MAKALDLFHTDAVCGGNHGYHLSAPKHRPRFHCLDYDEESVGYAKVAALAGCICVWGRLYYNCLNTQW